MGINRETGEVYDLDAQADQVMEVLRRGEQVVPVKMTDADAERIKMLPREVRRALARRETGSKVSRSHRRVLREAGL